MKPVTIAAVSAWAPGLNTRAEWLDFFQGKRSPEEDASPDVSAIPALLRRRMSRLTRMSVAMALDCCSQAGVSAADVPVVMASRHGEMDVTLKLLEQLTAQDTLSPMDFSGSVHHTAIGYFSIVAQNRRPMRAVAGLKESFCYGFLDALNLLAERPDQPVLFLMADDRVPSPFDAGDRAPFPYALAFLLSPGSGSGVSLQLRPAASSAPTAPRSEEAALRFLKWWWLEKEPLEWHSARKVWRWEK